MAKQSGWKFADAAYVFADAGAYPAVVSGWNADRIYGIAPGKAMEDIYDSGRGGRASRSDPGGPQPR